MKNTKKSIAVHSIMGVALIAAVSTTAYYRSAYLEIKNQSPKVVTKTIKAADTTNNDAEVAALKQQITDLEAVLKTKDSKVATNVQPKNSRQRRTLQELKVENPERYQKIVDYYTKISARVANGVADKMVFFNELDTSEMTEKELENHQKLLEKLAKLHEDTEKAGLDNNPDAMRDTMKSQWKNYREISKLMKKERDFLIIDAGRKMGFDDYEAKLLKDYVNNAYDITSGRSMFRGRGRGR